MAKKSSRKDEEDEPSKEIEEEEENYMENAKTWGHQLIKVLSYTNHNKFIVRGLYPNNVFVHKEELTIVPEYLIIPKMSDLEKIRYQSPEYLEKKLTLKSDTWSFGCILVHIVTGLPPFEGIDSVSEIRKTILEDRISPLNYCINNMKKEYEIIVDNPLLRILLW